MKCLDPFYAFFICELIIENRFSTFDELYRFAHDAKKAGVSALMLIEIQKTKQCPGPWYNGLQLCDHINGSYPAPDGSLAQWRQMLDEIRPVRLMWWIPSVVHTMLNG